jgi:hypothetical protein
MILVMKGSVFPLFAALATLSFAAEESPSLRSRSLVSLVTTVPVCPVGTEPFTVDWSKDAAGQVLYPGMNVSDIGFGFGMTLRGAAPNYVAEVPRIYNLADNSPTALYPDLYVTGVGNGLIVQESAATGEKYDSLTISFTAPTKILSIKYIAIHDVSDLKFVCGGVTNTYSLPKGVTAVASEFIVKVPPVLQMVLKMNVSGAIVSFDMCRKPDWTCVNDKTGFHADTGCDAITPLCVSSDRKDTLLPGASGKQCVAPPTCRNNQEGSAPDFGCSYLSPLCKSTTGQEIALNADGGKCFGLCKNIKNDGLAILLDSGCIGDKPLSMCPDEQDTLAPDELSTKSFKSPMCRNTAIDNAIDLGCGANKPLCTDSLGNPIPVSQKPFLPSMTCSLTHESSVYSVFVSSMPSIQPFVSMQMRMESRPLRPASRPVTELALLAMMPPVYH